MPFDSTTTKPEVDFPRDTPPADLLIEDITEGDGAEVAAGDTIEAHYVGVAWSTGEEFDSSWNRGEPLRFQIGVGQVITGWDEGIVGMLAGGRRKLTIPRTWGTARMAPAVPSDRTRRSSSWSTSSAATAPVPAQLSESADYRVFNPLVFILRRLRSAQGEYQWCQDQCDRRHESDPGEHSVQLLVGA